MKNFSFNIALAALLIGFAGAGSPVRAEEEGAKGLYFEQLDQPMRSLNTGVQYWIELHRRGQTVKVNNKHSFKSGDQIRFHVRANINGYAYIVLRNGSRGEQSVLFPEPGEDNRVRLGQDYALPREGFLTFDENPGLEKVTLLLSRTPLDAQAYLKPKRGEEVTLIASAATGSKDLIPSKILLAYSEPEPQPPVVKDEPVEKAKAQPAKPAQAAKTAAKPAEKKAPAQKAKAKKAQPATTASEKGQKLFASQDAQKHPEASPAAKHHGAPSQLEAGVVTVVHRDPQGVLAVEVDLDHM